MSDETHGQLVANGQRLPDIAARDSAGNAVVVPEMCADQYTAVLLYRGHW